MNSIKTKYTYKTDYIRTTKQLIISLSIILLIILWVNYLIPKSEAAEFWTKETQKKYEKVVELGFNKEFVKVLFEECKQTATDPTRCIKTWLFISYAESGGATNCYKNNCVGLFDGSKHYKSIREGVQDWVSRYNKYWHKQKNPSGFYRNDGTPPKTRYCMGVKKDWVCKNGTKNAWYMFNKLEFLWNK